MLLGSLQIDQAEWWFICQREGILPLPQTVRTLSDNHDFSGRMDGVLELITSSTSSLKFHNASHQILWASAPSDSLDGLGADLLIQ